MRTLPSFGKTFFVSFELLITEHTPGWRNVIHLTRGGENSRCGDRIPAVYVTPKNKLQIASCVNDKKDFSFYSSGQLEKDQWYQIEIEQVDRDGKVPNI